MVQEHHRIPVLACILETTKNPQPRRQESKADLAGSDWPVRRWAEKLERSSCIGMHHAFPVLSPLGLARKCLHLTEHVASHEIVIIVVLLVSLTGFGSLVFCVCFLCEHAFVRPLFLFLFPCPFLLRFSMLPLDSLCFLPSPLFFQPGLSLSLVIHSFLDFGLVEPVDYRIIPGDDMDCGDCPLSLQICSSQTHVGQLTSFDDFVRVE